MTAGHGGYAPTIGDVLDRDALDHVVVVDGQTHRALLVAGMSGGHEVLPTVLDPLDRPAEHPRGEHDRALLAKHEHLLAEAATDVACRDSDRTLRDLEVAGEEVAGLVHALARADDVQLLAPRHPGGDDAATLHRHAEVAVLAHRALHHVCRCGERVIEIRGHRGERHLNHRVGGETPGAVDEMVGVSGGTRVVNDRLGRIEVELDQLAGVLGDITALGDHDGDRFTDVAHIADGQRRWNLQLLAEHGVPRLAIASVEVLPREHGVDARKLEGGRRIEARDRRLRYLAP